jgi:hypothetical protein
MNVLDKNWLTDTPFDYELQKYKLLAATSKINALVQGGFLYSSLIEVEEHLADLYKLKNQKTEIDDRLKVLKGINLDTMSLDYDYPDQDPSIQHVYDLCDFAIQEFESVFRLIRSKWRAYSSKVAITEVPHIRPTKTKGTLFIKDSDSNIITYSYNNPLKIKGDWRDLNLKKQDLDIKNHEEMVEYIQLEIKLDSDHRFWRVDHKITHDHEDCVIPIVKHKLYHKI